MPFDNERSPQSGRTSEAEEFCQKCGMPKLTRAVRQAIHDGPWPKTGSGKVTRTPVNFVQTAIQNPSRPARPFRTLKRGNVEW